MKTSYRANEALGSAICYFTGRHWLVSLPLTDDQDYDLVVDDGTRLQKVQVKYAGHSPRPGVRAVELRITGGNKSRLTAKPFDRTTVDWLYVLDGDGHRYLIPAAAIESTRSISLSGRYVQFRI